MGSVVFIHGADYQQDRVRLYLHRTRFEVGMEAAFVAAGILDEQQARHSNPVSFDWIEYGELLQKGHPDDGTLPVHEAPKRETFGLGQEAEKYRCECCPTRKKKTTRNLYSWVGQGGRHMDSLIELVMDQKWSEIKAYLGSKRARAETVERVLSHLPDDVSAIVGHSFGSVVAVESLAFLGTDQAPELLVTAGSPLSIRAIRRELGGFTQDALQNRRWAWLNVYDRADVVTASRGLRNHFPGVLDLAVNNGSHGHAADYYLRHPLVGRWLWDAAHGERTASDFAGGPTSEDLQTVKPA